MDRISVNSSNIASIGYETKDRRLFVEFFSGKIYAYEDVDHEVFLAFMEAESKGRYFSANIRPHYTGTVHDSEGVDAP